MDDTTHAGNTFGQQCLGDCSVLFTGMVKQLTIIGLPTGELRVSCPPFHPLRVVFSSGICHARSFVCLPEKALEALKKGKYEDVIKWFKGLPPRSPTASRARWRAWPTSSARITARRRALRQGGDSRRRERHGLAQNASALGGQRHRRDQRRSAQTGVLQARQVAGASSSARRRPAPAAAAPPAARAASSDCACSWATRSAQ